MVTAEGGEVSLAGRLESFQSPRHKARLRPETAARAKSEILGPWNHSFAATAAEAFLASG